MTAVLVSVPLVLLLLPVVGGSPFLRGTGQVQYPGYCSLSSQALLRYSFIYQPERGDEYLCGCVARIQVDIRTQIRSLVVRSAYRFTMEEE